MQQESFSIRHIIQAFAVVEYVLRDRVAYFTEISRGEALPAKLVRLLTVVALELVMFGFVIGLSGRDVLCAVRLALKLPLLFLASGLICLPTLYYFSMLFGSRLRFLQTITLILTAQAVSAVLVLGFAPISLLFWLSEATPLFLVVLNITILGLSATLGLIFLVQGVLYVQENQTPESISLSRWVWMFVRGACRSLVLTGWLAIYGLVGAQLSWALRPFFGVPLGGYGL